MRRSVTPIVSALVPLLGCPSSIDSPRGQPVKQTSITTEKDPRVVRDGDDLYAKKVLERSRRLGTIDPIDADEESLGTAKSNETNGTCRLFAPRLKDPECCSGEFGFDAGAISEACGLPTYLGESFHHTCGYYFERPGQKPAWFRMSTVPGATPAESAKSHDTRMQRLLKDESFTSQPVPGIPGALWSTHDGLAWAFLPGWKHVRQFSWRPAFCSNDKLFGTLARIVAAGEPEPGAKRSGLIPKARPPAK